MSLRKKNEIKRIAFPFVIIGIGLAIVLIIGSFIKIEPKNTGQELEVQSEGVADSQIASSDVAFEHLSIKTPTGWSEVKEEKGKAFIHSASNSAIYIDKHEYKPEVNLILQNPTSFLPANSVFTDSKTNNQNEASIYYETPSNAGTYYCGQKYIWDKDEVYVITVNINSMHYEKMPDVMDFIFDSTKLNNSNPIAPDTFIHYAPEYKCEYGLPINWIEENGILTDGTNSLTIITKSTPVDLKSYNSLNFSTDYNIQDGIVSSVKYDEGKVIADGEISNNGGKIKAYIVSSDKYTIAFIWRYSDEKVAGIAKDCIQQYRTF